MTSVGIVVNSVTNLIYVSNSFSLSSIKVIDGETNKTVDGIGLRSSGELAVNLANNHMCVVRAESVITVLDVTTLVVR